VVHIMPVIAPDAVAPDCTRARGACQLATVLSTNAAPLA
jgi:hypothetical protein